MEAIVSRSAGIDIGKAVDPPKDGAARQPYFGAILTAAGRDAISKVEG